MNVERKISVINGQRINSQGGMEEGRRMKGNKHNEQRENSIKESKRGKGSFEGRKM